MMQIPKDATLLRIFLSPNARSGRGPLHEVIVLRARAAGLMGATVLRGRMGFGHSRRLHLSKVWHLSEDCPFVIEIVDSEEKINAFLPTLDQLMTTGLVILEPVRTHQYGLRG